MKIAALILMSLFACAATAQESAEATLRKGVVLEEVDRNLNAAIQTYQSVAARSKEDRQAAATALFRMAECYRKLGKNTEAASSYRLVANEFADQKKLAEDSRKQLALVAPLPAGSVPTSQAEAKKVFRGLLEEEIGSAAAMWYYTREQRELGAISELDTYDAQATLARLQGQLAAFDAGLFPKQPSSPRTAQARKARQDYRASLLTAVDFARKNFEAEKKKYELGAVEHVDLIRAQMKSADVQLQLAAFDAGLSYTPMAGALAR